MENYERTIISQYDRSATLRTWLEAFDQWMQPDADIAAFHRDIWDIDTATGYGLDVWARIVGLGELGSPARAVPVVRGEFWGFAECNNYQPPAPSAWPYRTVPEVAVGDAENEGGRPFWNGDYDKVVLGDEDTWDPEWGFYPGFRRLILAKAAANIWDGSIGAANHVMRMLFEPFGTSYVLDNRDMTMTWRFHDYPSDVMCSVLTRLGVMPKPAGVGARVDIATGETIWDDGATIWDGRKTIWDRH
jgi:hypothetical protein